MSDFVVGPGIAQALAENGDEARSDEIYLVLAEGRKISQVYGRDAEYVWIEQDGAVRRIPF